jgi:formylglycine-generating enzyme required for sulfatase activity
MLEFERAVQQSRRTLLVLTPAYLADSFSQFVDLLVQSYGLESATWPIVPLTLQPVALPPRLSMLTALDATDPEGWPDAVERLCAALQRPAPGPVARPDCPYPGMAPFREADSVRFFGREREVRELLERLRLHPFVTVIGPSGSGKSSLVYAGLLPALRTSSLFGQGDWLARSMRPGEEPLAALAGALKPRERRSAGAAGGPDDLLATLLSGAARPPDNSAPAPSVVDDPDGAVDALLAATPGANRLLLFVDQFEETFTVARQDAALFQQALLRLAAHPQCFVILTVRADFYPDLMVSPLWPRVQAHRMEVVPLNDDGLRQAIARPAENAGVFVEAALVERLLADAAGEPGALPLIQETLVLLWERLERRFLPLSAYTALVLPRSAYDSAMGDSQHTGLQVALARRADAALAELPPEGRDVARRIFLRLIAFGEGRLDTRRQQPVAALRAAGDEALLFETTLRHLAAQRLLTLGGHERGAGRLADIAHEALIAGWPMLRRWMNERREAEQARRRLDAQAARWAARARSGLGGALLDEVELREAEQWLAGPDAADLGYSPALPELAAASRAAIEQAEREKQDTRERELAQAKALAQAERSRSRAQRRVRQRTWALVGIVVLVICGLVARPLYGRWVRFTIGTELVEIPSGVVKVGVFNQGGLVSNLSSVNLSAFRIEKYEVSDSQYQACVAYGPCTDSQEPNTDYAKHPVNMVTPQQAESYCNWIGRWLPTSVEWDRAARGPTGLMLPWGDSPPAQAVQPSFGTSSVDLDTMPDGATSEHVFHLADNVAEWVILVNPNCKSNSCYHPWSIGAFSNQNVGYAGGTYQSPWYGETTPILVQWTTSDSTVGFRCVTQ